ncbi:hypothetical protein V8E54_013892 [Elaphomyces granulatus]
MVELSSTKYARNVDDLAPATKMFTLSKPTTTCEPPPTHSTLKIPPDSIPGGQNRSIHGCNKTILVCTLLRRDNEIPTDSDQELRQSLLNYQKAASKYRQERDQHARNAAAQEEAVALAETRVERLTDTVEKLRAELQSATTWRTRGTDPDEKLTGKDPDKYGPWRFDVDLKLEIDAPILVNRARIDCSAHLLVSIELVRSGIPLTNECDCKEFRKWLLPCEHMLEGFLYGDAVEPDWDKYSSLFLDQKFDVYEGKRTEMVMDAGGDSQEDRSMEKMLASSKLDMEETANKIKDRRYTIEDQIRLSGMTPENAERVMRAYNRSLAMAAERLAGMSIDELLQFEASDSV